MSDIRGKTTRRSFFVHGGAVLGAGLATAGTALAGDAPVAPSGDAAADREAIRELHARFLRHVENGEHGAAAALYDRSRDESLLTHHAYRRGASQADDLVHVEPGGAQATATFHVEAEIREPLAGNCTAAQMARLQGNVESRTWRSGRFDARYVKGESGWRIAELRWSAA